MRSILGGCIAASRKEDPDPVFIFSIDLMRSTAAFTEFSDRNFPRNSLDSDMKPLRLA